jgi:hypothetical protein
LEVAPTVKQPINNVEAIALRQELDNLIGRFESAQLTANATNSSGTRRSERPSATNAVAQARAIAKALPQLIKQQDYADCKTAVAKSSTTSVEQLPKRSLSLLNQKFGQCG